MTPPAPTVRSERSDGTVVLTLNRPHAANAIDGQMLADLDEALAAVRADDTVRAVVVTGAGRHFSAGADLREPRAQRAVSRRRYGPADLSGLAVPTIAAVNGPALGGGCELALSCDVRLMADDALIGLPEVQFGALPTGGGTARLPRLVGPGQAKRLILSGDVIDAAEAARIGLVEQVVPAAALLAQATDLAARMSRGPAYAVRTAKRLIDTALEADLPDALAAARSAAKQMAGADERATARQAAARRSPVYARLFGEAYADADADPDAGGAEGAEGAAPCR